MLTALFPKIKDVKFTQAVRAFIGSAYYPFFIAALMAISEIFALELFVYYIYLLVGFACAFLCDDTRGFLPIVCCSYMTFAFENSAHNPTVSKPLFEPANMMQLVFILAVTIALFLGRLVTCVVERPNKKIPALTFGFLALLVGYLLAGVGYSGYDAWKAVLFAFAQIIALSAFYFYFYYTIDWKTVDKSYIFYVFLAIGVGLLAEIAMMYTHEGVLVKDLDGGWSINRDSGNLCTGWGIYNNVGCAMAMCVPAPMYFAVKNEKWGWVYSLIGCLFMLGVAFTQSRGSILFGSIVFIACIIAVLTMSRGRNRILNAVIFAAMFVALILAVILFYDKLGGIFSAIEETIMHIVNDEAFSSGRFEQYKSSLGLFKEHPLLGVGFHNLGRSGGVAFINNGDGTVLIPTRAHNTFIELLASGGLVATACYLFHRGQTLWLWLKKPNFEKTMAAFIIAAMLLTSLLDCHFFNYGPGLLYSCVLVYGECCASREEKRIGM